VNASYRCRLWPLVAALVLVVAVGRVYPQWVEDSIEVPGAWVGNLVYNSRQDEVWGTTSSGSAAYVISCDSNKLVATVPIHWPFMLAYDSADNKTYISYQGAEQDSLAVIDCKSRAIIKRLEMPGATMPVWDGGANRLYVSCQTTGRVAVVDCRTDSLLKYIEVGWYPIKMYLNTLRRKLYVLNSDAGTVSVIDLRTDSVISTATVGGIPNAGYYSRRVDKFYSGGDDIVAVLDGMSDSVVARIPVAPHTDVFAISGNDSRGVILASVYGGGSRLYTIDALADTVVAVLEVTRATYDIELSSQSDRFYCPSALSDEVAVLSGDGRQHLTTLPVGDAPFILQVVPRHRRIYVGHLNRSLVYVIRDADIPWPEGQPAVPDTAAGLQLRPNPFCGNLSIVSGREVTAKEARIYGEDGRLVRVLNMAKSASSVLRASWNGKDNRGRSVPAGVYFVEAAGASVRAKVVKQR
jgi:YVTN family beta-propeller protein